MIKYLDIQAADNMTEIGLVIELKDTELMPEYIGKLNFYCSAVDDIQKPIGWQHCTLKNPIEEGTWENGSLKKLCRMLPATASNT